jgi:hypothetical protein
MNKTEVHHYDGLLRGRYQPAIVRSTSDKIQIIQNLYTKLVSVQAKRATMLILNSLRVSPHDNIDTTNHVDASDVLCDLVNHPSIKEVWPLFEEQLGDIMGGICPQGRADRLLQVYFAL